jgi:hypothetical protein
MTEHVPVRTVNDLIERLKGFNPDMPIRVQQATSKAGHTDFVFGVGTSPDEPGIVAVFWVPRPE